MKQRDKNVIASEVTAFLNSINDLSTIDKTLANKIKLSLKETPNYIEKGICPFDSNLGPTLDLIVDFFNENGITKGAKKEFNSLVKAYISSIADDNDKDESFMIAKKTLTHLQNLKKSIIIPVKQSSSTSSSDSPSPSPSKSKSKLTSLFKKLKTKLKSKKRLKKEKEEKEKKEKEEKEKKEAEELLKIVSAEVLSRYIDIVMNLLKLEKYRLTEKLTVKDDEIYYSSPDSQSPVNKSGVWELTIKHITSKDFMPTESDIVQGNIGDCYLLAALKNIVRSDPNIIKKCFVANKKDGIVVRFYKVTVTTQIKNDNMLLESKATGRIAIKMDKTILVNSLTNNKFGNNGASLSSIWVNLMEKAYAIFVSKDNIIDKNLDFERMGGTSLCNKLHQNNNLAAVEGGYTNIPTTAITGKKGISFLPYSTQQPTSTTSGNAPGNYTPQPTEKQVKSPINPSTIVGIIKKEISGGKAMSVGSQSPGHPCWKTPMIYQGQYMTVPLDKYLTPGHAYSVKGIEKVGSIEYVVLSNPHMSTNGFMITGNVFTAYGKTGDVYLTTNDLCKYFCAYFVNKLKKGKRA